MSHIAFKIEIHPVMIKKFDADGVKPMLSHYMGYIHGISHLGFKNLYLNNNRHVMIDEMFATLSKAKIIAI